MTDSIAAQKKGRPTISCEKCGKVVFKYGDGHRFCIGCFKHKGKSGAANPAYKGAGRTIACEKCGKKIVTYNPKQTHCIHCFDKSGSKNPRWRGGITTENRRIRKSPEYAAWRKSVFERDDYVCQLCGERGGDLHADHIKPFCAHPELRLELSNGRTLCVACHRKTPTFMAGALKYLSSSGLWDACETQIVANDVVRKSNGRKTPEERSESLRTRHAKTTAEQKHAVAMKGVATRRAKAAALLAELSSQVPSRSAA